MNQYLPKYVKVKKVVKPDGTPCFLEKDHINAVEDTLLYETTRVGRRIEPFGSDLITILDHIAQDAISGENKIDTISRNGVTLPISSERNVDITVPTKVSDLTEDATHRTVTDEEKETWTNKQDTIVFQSGNYDKTTNKALAKSDLDAAITSLGTVLKFRGVFEHLGDVTDPQNGDVVIVEDKEYVYTTHDNQWHEFGKAGDFIIRGNVTNSDVKNDAAIAQSKIAGLVDDLASKVNAESGKSLVTDTEIAKIHDHSNKDVLDTVTSETVTNAALVPNKVSIDTQIAGINLHSDITADQLRTGLNVEDGSQANKIESITINDCDLTVDATTKKASGNVKPFQAFLDTWPVENETMADLCTAISKSEKAGLVHVGSYFMGEIAYMDPMPIGIGNAEVTMYVPTEGLYIFTMTSTTTSPYHWEANGEKGSFSGWRQVLTIKEPTEAGKYIAYMEAKDEVEIYESNVKWKKDTKVENTTTVAGIALTDNITADALKTALGTQDLTFTFSDNTTKTYRFVCSEVTA